VKKEQQKPGLLRPREWRERWLSENIQKILKNLPTTPWVYQMKDDCGGVMYVGKAKSLRNRVLSYFRDVNIWNQTPLNPPFTGGSMPLSPAKRQMVAKIRDIEIITCQTEVEALVLETNLIKHLSPKYNILMKDDKNLAYLKFTHSPVPELIKTRQRIRDGGVYFGPFVSGVEQSVRALRKIFKIRNCRMKFVRLEAPLIRGVGGLVSEISEQTPFNSPLSGGSSIQITDKAGKTIPCMDYYIWLCPAPCLLKSDTLEQHEKNISRAQSFLSGDTAEVFAELTAEMQKKAKNLEFEEAQEIKETLEALKWLYEKQKVRDIIEWDVDICLMYEKYEKTYIWYTQIRSNQIVWVFRYELWAQATDRDDIIVEFLMRQYVNNYELWIMNYELWDLPGLLLLQNNIIDEAFIDFLQTKKIKVEIPKIWPKKEIIDFTLTQVREYAYKKELASLENKTLTREHMKNVLTTLGYPVPMKWEIVFECYDISHTDGHFTYASRVCIVDGKPDTGRYKKYKIKTLADGDIDDFASHREVMVRRTLEWLEQNNFPHLIIIDGGKWQLSSAISWIQNAKFKMQNDWAMIQNSHYLESWILNLESIKICSIAKREEEIFLPWEKNPVLFEKWTPELMVLQKARDESHRFSITANKTARMKSMKKNILEEIPWIGPVTRKKLLKLAGSIDEIKNVNMEDIQRIITKSQLQILKDHWII